MDAVEDVTRGHRKTKQGDYLADGRFPIIDQGQKLIGGYTNDESVLSHLAGPVIIFGDHTRCVKYIDFPFGPGADGVKVLRAREGVDPRYLYHYIRTLKIHDGGYSRHFKYLKEAVVPLPPMDEQHRIAAVLDAADALQAKRYRALSKLNTLTQSIFIDMFGDPLANQHGYPQRRLGDIALKFSDGPFGSNLKSEHYAETGVRVVRLQNIGVGSFIDEDAAYISLDHFETLRKHECVPGDVLVGTMGDPNLRACVQPAWLTQALNKADCVQIRVDGNVASSVWLASLLNCPSTEAKARSLVKGQTRARISMGRLRELEVPVPPISLQSEFVDRVAVVKASSALAMESLGVLNSLLASLQQRAFRGEL
jgi:type I restriction enzyme S subunit